MIINGKEVELVKIERTQGPYIMLENDKSDKGHGKGLHILRFTQEQPLIKIGRGH